MWFQKKGLYKTPGLLLKWKKCTVGKKKGEIYGVFWSNYTVY